MFEMSDDIFVFFHVDDGAITYEEEKQPSAPRMASTRRLTCFPFMTADEPAGPCFSS